VVASSSSEVPEKTFFPSLHWIALFLGNANLPYVVSIHQSKLILSHSDQALPEPLHTHIGHKSIDMEELEQKLKQIGF